MTINILEQLLASAPSSTQCCGSSQHFSPLPHPKPLQPIGWASLSSSFGGLYNSAISCPLGPLVPWLTSLGLLPCPSHSTCFLADASGCALPHITKPSLQANLRHVVLFIQATLLKMCLHLARAQECCSFQIGFSVSHHPHEPHLLLPEVHYLLIFSSWSQRPLALL